VVRQPETHYAKGPEGNIAYQVVGEGPIDLMIVPGWLSHLDLLWQEPGWVTLMGELESFARVIRYDKLGTGLSDPIDRPVTLDTRAAEIRAVLDAVGSERPALLGFSEGAPISVMFAATYPERVSALVLYGAYHDGSLDDDGTPGRKQWIRLGKQVGESIEHWGQGRSVDWAAPSLSRNLVYRRAVGALERACMSPSMALLTYQGNLTHIRVTDILESVHVPTLVLHRKNETIPVEFARQIAAAIPSAKLVELDGIDHWPTVGDIKSVTGEIEEFLTGERHEHTADRMLATVLFTDIVDSTRRAAELGDRGWREVLERHDELTRSEVDRCHGRVVKHTGDGFLATFDGPTRALRCATTLSERITDLGVDVRSGLHTGECEIRGDDIGGIAVHIGARIAALAKAREVLVSSTVKDLVNGSGIAFQERGIHQLKGVPGQWRLYAPQGHRRPTDYHLPDKRRGFQEFMADRISKRPRLARTVLRMSYRR
jgi:class 3 adenylate cyclase